MQKILAIDDKLDNLVALSALLKNLIPDCVVITAQSGMEGIEKTVSEFPDAILLDVKMPGVDGFETCRRLKSDESTKHIPVIMITAIKTDPQSRIKGLEIGADTFLAKPIDPYELVSQVKVALRIKKAEDTLREERNSLERLVEERTAAVVEVKESARDFLENVINAIADPVFVKDDKRRFVLVNEALCAIVSRPREALIGEDGDDMFSEEETAVVREMDANVLDTGKENVNEESLSNLSSGEVRTIVTRKTRYIDPNGNHFLVGVIRDITERKTAERALLKSEMQLRTLVDSIPDLVWLKDLNGFYLSCNPIFERFFGAKESVIVGKTDYDFIDKDLADFFRKHDRRTMSAGRPCINEEWLTFADDGYKGLFETIKSPMYDVDGDLIGVLGVARDISERKNTEHRLRESEQRYKSAQRMGQVGNWEYDLATEEFWASDQARRIYGFDPKIANFTTDKVENCIPERERVHQALIDLIEQSKPYNLEYDIQPITGPPKKTIRSIAEMLFDENGEPQKVIGVVQDITIQKMAEKEKILLERQLKQSQKMESIGNLAGGIAHDFNNILSSVLGFTELALDDISKGTPLEDNLQEVYTAGKRARDLVKQILAFARQSDEVLKPIRVDTISKEVIQLIRSTIPTTIKINQEIKSDSLIMGNQTQVHQVLMNLCTNAAYAMEDTGGVLEVRVTDVELNDQPPQLLLELKSGKYMNVIVSDTGPGIPPDIIGSIFEPYFTTKSVGEGTGMGLALVHGIIESYGGKIIVDSILGKGTVFSIYLPVTKKRDDHRPYEKEDLPSGTEHILFVDDELPIAKMGSQILEQLGYQVTVRTSSVEALELFRSKPRFFDLVISDMTMPNMTGDELAMELIAFRSDIPVIICTGYSKKITEEKAAKIGIKALAYKPIVKADLAKTVRKVLDEAMDSAK